MKRTPKNGGDKRDLIVRFRATADEITTMKRYAKQEKTSLSGFIRRKLNRPDKYIDRTDYIRLLAEIGKQGSNLNQYAKAMNIWINTGRDPSFKPEMIKQCVEQITRLTGELMEILKHGHRRKNQG